MARLEEWSHIGDAVTFSLTTFGGSISRGQSSRLIEADELYVPVQGHRFDNGQPLLERAEPGGEELAQHVCSVVQKQSATLAELWAALSCLQHATDEENKVCVFLPEDRKQVRCRAVSGSLS